MQISYSWEVAPGAPGPFSRCCLSIDLSYLIGAGTQIVQTIQILQWQPLRPKIGFIWKHPLVFQSDFAVCVCVPASSCKYDFQLPIHLV